MTRRAVLLALAATIGFVIGCGPEVHQHVTATARVWVTGADSALYRVDVSLYAITGQSVNGGRSTISYDIARCVGSTCAAPVRYLNNLEPSAYDVTDMKRVLARSAAFGSTVSLTFTGAGPSGDVNTTPQAEEGTYRVALASKWAAAARVEMFGVVCEDKAAQAGRYTSAYPEGYLPGERGDAAKGPTPGTPPLPVKCAAAPK